MGRSDGFGTRQPETTEYAGSSKYDDAPAIQEGRNQPPVPINKTIRPDYIISLEDGRRYKSLKRHLSSRGLTPEQYRKKWGLRADYPMVAANYAKARSELAKAIGLGQKGKDRTGAKKDFRLMPSTMDSLVPLDGLLLYQSAYPAKQGMFFWAVSSTEESTNLDVLNLPVRRILAQPNAPWRDGLT